MTKRWVKEVKTRRKCTRNGNNIGCRLLVLMAALGVGKKS